MILGYTNHQVEDNMSVQEFGVKGYLGVILSNCLNMLTLCLHYLIDFDETWRPEVSS